MDHVISTTRSAPSIMSLLLAMDRSETVRCFGWSEKPLWTMLQKERYKNCLRHGTVEVLDFDDYGPNYIRDTFRPFYKVHITSMGRSETVTYFGTHEKALQNILLSKERY